MTEHTMTPIGQADAATLSAGRQEETALGVVNRYLDGFYRGDHEAARAEVAPDFSFKGPFLEVVGKESFFAGAAGLKRIVRGHRMLRQWVQGGDICSVYEVTLETPAGAGSLPMSEWHTVRDGHLIAGRVLFDSAAFRALVP